MTCTFAPIQIFTPRRGSETLFDFGARVFAYLLTNHSTTVMRFDDAALEQALAASQVLVTGKDCTPGYREQLSERRQQIMRTLDWRRAAAAREAKASPITVGSNGNGHGPAPEPEMTNDQLVVAMLTEVVRLVTEGKNDKGGGGGKGARLRKPQPNLPPGGVALGGR